MSSWSSKTSRNVVLDQQDTPKCRAGAAGQVEISSESWWNHAKRSDKTRKKNDPDSSREILAQRTAKAEAPEQPELLVAAV